MSINDIQRDSLDVVGNVSNLLRQALMKALPVAPEQYLTIAVPGTVIDLVDSDQGGSFVWDQTTHAFAPTIVRVNEARLVDGMMPLSNVMIGNTGKSVSRAYSRALDGLVPKVQSVSAGGIRSPGNAQYQASMKYLTTPNAAGVTPVDTYNKKLTAWGDRFAEWQAAKIEARKQADAKFGPKEYDDYIARRQQWYLDWNQETYYHYKSLVQGAYMDWVANGDKSLVEYNFGLVDVDSIMGRIEHSKESLRNSMIVDVDGANEVPGVVLTPSKWATYCKRKAEGWYTRNGLYTIDQLYAEITRLTDLQDSYVRARELTSTKQYPATDAGEQKPTVEEATTARKEALDALYKAQAALAGAAKNKDEDKIKAAKTEVKSRETALAAADEALKKAELEFRARQLVQLTDTGRQNAVTWFNTKIAAIGKQIEGLKELLSKKQAQAPMILPVIGGANSPPPAVLAAPADKSDKPAGAGAVVAATEPAKAASGTILADPEASRANAVFGLSAEGTEIGGAAGTGSGLTDAENADPWTHISFSYADTDQKARTSEYESGMNVGGSVGWGLWSLGGAYSSNSSSGAVQQEMANCSVSISFSAMVVNINRPWLYGELFNDYDLDVAEDVKLSPGPMLLQEIIRKQVVGKMAQYCEFPAYPTSFVVAADTTIEFIGNTQRTQAYFNSYSSSSKAGFGYGPWSVGGGYSSESSSKSMQVHTTATGCKILFGAPQVIGWVSQILPALPRDQNNQFDPLTQGAGVPVSGL